MQMGNLSKFIISGVMVAFLAACSTTGETTDATASTQAAQVAVDNTSLAEAQALIEAAAAAKAAAAEAKALAAAAVQAEAKAAADAAKAAADAAQQAAANVAQQQQQAQEAAQALAHIIYFDFDQSTIKAEFRTALNGHAAYLSQNPSASIVLEGHADERGTREYNIALGERRGNAVSRYLVVQGVSIDAIEVVSFGEERPVNAGHDSASWSENRRVEIRYINY
ncbi:peptidoglycan-associated lipoprotein Pal [Candidatus Njordibacter sp. Uisw_039]|jgi:peptidoglycan-associated lipoprotein|uniref:peptidoglycan-associated lipoprotein Pal n=1 Tax=Candidatus Njordibacter sp. Uisw_039 TaxID=3230972 RepID=UPI003A483545|tara:strand:+ start:813 stop:1484 length:672 start_codon:yes stop_codon:yes gene_type:complete